MMCIPFICMFVGLPSWVCVVCGLVVCWLKHVPFSFLFLLVSPFPALSESCIALSRCSCAHLEEMYPGRSEGCGVLCKRQQSLDVFDTLLRGMVICYSYSLLCIIVDCQDDLYCGVHVPYGDVLLRKLLICCCFCTCVTTTV